LVAQTLGKLQASISSGSFYEAQQMLKTVHARHRNKRAYDASYRLAEVRSPTSLYRDPTDEGNPTLDLERLGGLRKEGARVLH
jgi:hypothetical protein